MRLRSIASVAVVLLVLPILVFGAPPELRAQEGGDDGAFVTRLGDDTVAVERFTVTDDGVRALVTLRVPRTSLRAYDLRFGTGDGPARMTVERYDPAMGPGGEPTESRETVLGEGEGLPFIDMVHWPFEVVFRRAVDASRDSGTYELVTRRGGIPFRVIRRGPGNYGLAHPTRGTMDVRVDGEGRIVRLDASNTTRALLVTREESVDVEGLARRYAAMDARGEGMGELSGRGSAEATVHGAEITVDYGRPLKRGREIFGGLVPWNEVWRTGANRATHFSTDRGLRAGGTFIPPGTYTLFTIPRPGGWTLLVNERTDINGQAYDADHDLARLEMETRRLRETVEPFTIRVDETEDGGGVLRLRWDRTEAFLPFRVVR